MSTIIDDQPSYTIKEFCALERISTVTYCKLRAQGRGPREMRLNAAIRITHQARLDWQRQNENLEGTAAKAQAETDANLLRRARDAVTASVASPRHRSKQRRARG